MTKVTNSFQKQPIVSKAIQELVEACGYYLKTDCGNGLVFVNGAGNMYLRFGTDGFIMFQQMFDAEDDRKAELVTMFSCTIRYSITDIDLSLILQTVGAIDFRGLSEYKDYLRTLRPGGNAAYFGIRSKAVA